VVSTEPLRLSMLSDRQKHPAQGLLGGGPGMPVALHLQDGRKPHPKSRSVLQPGDRLTIRMAGGGGYGDPARRDPAVLRHDVAEGYVTPAGAARDYGVKSV
jgi:N-methylhydantoinase B